MSKDVKEISKTGLATDIAEEFIKNRAKFEWAVLAVIGFFVTNYFLTGQDIPETYIQVFYACIVAYVIIFIMDVMAPIFKAVLIVWTAENPPQWVKEITAVREAQNSLLAQQTKLLEALPLAICPFNGDDPPVHITAKKQGNIT